MSPPYLPLPSPGNLLRTPDGRLAYLDFGMMGQIDERVRNALMTATLHLVNREYGRYGTKSGTTGHRTARRRHWAACLCERAACSSSPEHQVAHLSADWQDSLAVVLVVSHPLHKLAA